MIDVRPSLLAADWMNLGRDIGRVTDAGVKWLHFDVMDAHFVPNLSFGPALCAAVKKSFPRLLLDVHLMMDNPEKYLEVFAKAGADALTVHAEAAEDLSAMLRRIRGLGVMSGASVKPATPVDKLIDCRSDMDLALIMTVEPGFGGQAFMPEQLPKITALRDAGFQGDISVDGGVSLKNARQVTAAGANVLVMGTAVFGAPDPAAVLADCRDL